MDYVNNLLINMPLVFASPPISLSTAHLFAAFFTFSYVGSLYLAKSARLSFKKSPAYRVRDGEERERYSDERWRNDPDVIRARLLAASASTLLSVYVVYWLVQRITPEYEVCFLSIFHEALCTRLCGLMDFTIWLFLSHFHRCDSDDAPDTARVPAQGHAASPEYSHETFVSCQRADEPNAVGRLCSVGDHDLRRVPAS